MRAVRGRAGGVSDYGYADALKRSGIVWNDRHLDGFLNSPLNYVRGTSMGYAGLQNQAGRRDLIADLKQATRDASLCAGTEG